MFDELSLQTREIVTGICQGSASDLGGKRIEPFTDEEKRLLAILASNLSELKIVKGQDLVKKILGLLESVPDEEQTPTEMPQEAQNATDHDSVESHTHYRLVVVRACSFRGLAPAGRTWEFDFGGESHLMYGPNGCGKSSLLGAISYCLTGRIFRDDQPPDLPMNEKVYPAEGGTHATERPDALALMDESGRSTAPDAEFWVEVQLVGDDQGDGRKEVLVRRHSSDGLTVSVNGEPGVSVQSLRDVGIDELDAELNLIMLARLPHMRFGKDAELIRILSQVIGLDDLEAIADVAGRLIPALRSEVTRNTRPALVREEESIAEACGLLKEMDSDLIAGLDSYADAVGDKATLADVETFGKAIKGAIETNNRQLATDLGIDVPAEDSEGFPEFKEALVNLPGQVQTVIEELGKPLAELFSNSLGFSPPTEDEYSDLKQELEEFQTRAQEQVKERLDWARTEKVDAKARLMLLAAGHFHKGDSNCPVCDQDLVKVSEVRQKLERLRPLAACPNLDAAVEDVESRLLRDLDGVVSSQQRIEGATGLSKRILTDWQSFQKIASKGLLRQVVATFDAIVETASEQFLTEDVLRSSPLAHAYTEGFPEAFHRVDEAIAKAEAYLQLCGAVMQHESVLRDTLAKMLTAEQCNDVDDSLKVILERGRTANEGISTLIEGRRVTKDLYTGIKKKEELLEKIKKHEAWASFGDRVKSLAGGVRDEVIRMVRKLETKTKEYYAKLYDNEILVLDMLTPGHAGNANVKGEINAYYRAGQERVPVGPFSNAGRFRALVLSFVFALLNESRGTLAVTILDDPTVSLDDEHKARFVDHLVEPLLTTSQVVLATHYEKFFKDSEPVFADAKRLYMTPRRREADVVSFEPGDLLERVKVALDNPTSSWKEAGGNLRIWAERTLGTLSAYCSKPFVVFNNVPASIEAYKGIEDENVATAERDQIVRALRSPKFERVLHKCHHNEEFTETDVADGLKSLESCRKAICKELKRFKQLYSHSLAGRGIPGSGSTSKAKVEVFELADALSRWTLNIVREAAAAHNGEGIEWDQNDVHSLEGHQVVIATTDSVSPIVLRGQRVLLDNQDRIPMDGELVVVKTAEEKRYFRRFWAGSNDSPMLEATNPTNPILPIQLSNGVHMARRVVGVLFDSVELRGDSETAEWVPAALPDGWFADTVGLRIKGTSMEPIVREDQIVLVRKGDESQIEGGDLCCVDIVNAGTVIKRCYPSEDEWVLCSVNPNDLEDPMRVKNGDILHAYPLVGIMFELDACA
jgi:SOS-response transcriptional repressor LexA